MKFEVKGVLQRVSCGTTLKLGSVALFKAMAPIQSMEATLKPEVVLGLLEMRTMSGTSISSVCATMVDASMLGVLAHDRCTDLR